MIKEMPELKMIEKRRFERIDLKEPAQVLVLDNKGRRVGTLRQLARGGFSMEPERMYEKDGKVHHFTIHELAEDIRADVSARVRFADNQLAGFEFVDLTPAAAVELGIIIGKYYETGKE
jgi:hypothetical protein